MKKTIILSVLVILVLALVAGTAFAGGWWMDTPTGEIGTWNAGDPGPPAQAVGQTYGLVWTTDTLGNTVWEDAWGNGDGTMTSPWYNNNGSSTTTMEDRWLATGIDWGGRHGGLEPPEPHGGFADSTNYCKTCHAIHDAGSSSYRLLKSGNTTETRTAGEGVMLDGTTSSGGANGGTGQAGMGNSRANECMYCHDASSGATAVRPYALALFTAVRGEHTLGSSIIPDSNIDSTDTTTLVGSFTGESTSTLPDRDPVVWGGIGPILECYTCHSVHGANIVKMAEDGNAIMRTAPGFDPNYDTDAWGTDRYISPFCVACHNKNDNYMTTETTVGAAGSGYNPTSHIQGPAADGTMEVYGVLTKVATASDRAYTSNDVRYQEPDQKRILGFRGLCRGCHSASSHGMGQHEVGGLQSSFPHQSMNAKFLNDALKQAGRDDSTGTAGIANNSDRNVSHMDEVCLRCHRWNDSSNPIAITTTATVPGGAGNSGVGLTF